jgi:photosystem II stability/assembly factor-like uncharacterized protein
MATRSLQTKLCSLAIIFFLMTSLAGNAQLNPAVGAGPWKYVVPYQHGFNLNDMSFADNKTGLAVGTNGAIARTTDSGRNWQYIPFKFINSSNAVALAQFNDVQFVTPEIAYAVGASGLMIKSTDGGLNWSRGTTPRTALSKNINGLHFINKDTGYIGGAAINTTNTTNVNDAPKVYFTKNGGVTWDSLTSPFRPQQNNITLSGFNSGEVQRIFFVNDSVGYISGSCGQASPNYSSILWKYEKGILKDYSIHRTKFGVSITTGVGSNPTQCTQTYKGLVGVNDSLVIISSNSNGIALRIRTGQNDSTANAVPAIYGAYEKGKYELILQLNTNPSIPPGSTLSTGAMWHIKKAPNGTLVMSDGSKIAFSIDNGTNWTSTQIVPATSNIAHWGFTAVDVTPNGRIIAAGFNGMTYDSLPGASWKTVYKNIRPLFYSYTDMDWADNCNGIIVGANGSIAKTSDAGQNWEDISNPIFDASQISLTNVFYPAVNSMYFSTNTFGFIGIHKSSDQGASYQTIFAEPNPNTGGITNFTMWGQTRAWAIGYRFSPEVQRTMIFRSLNANAGSPVWDTVKTFPFGTFAPQLKSIRFANQDTGYTCGSRGKVYRTIDAGATWTDVSPDTTAAGNATATYNTLSIINGKTLYVGGSSRKLFKSTDAGVTWTDLTLVQTTNPITIAVSTSITNVLMNDVNNGYINAGSYLLTTTNGWATWTYDMAPQSASNISLYPKMVAPIQNKKLYLMPLIFGFPGPISTQSAALIEYGNAALVNVSSSEVLTATCDNVAEGSIVINATGGVAPYTYSINGGSFQASNTFTGLTQGNKTITIKDAACGVTTKTVTIDVKASPSINAGPDVTIVGGDQVTLQGSSSGTAATIAWTPAASLTGAATLTPVAKPSVTTNYILNIKDINGCVYTDNSLITVIP